MVVSPPETASSSSTREATLPSSPESTAPALVLLAAGRSSRYGRPKQLDPLGPGGASLTAYTVLDALRAGFGSVVLVVRPDLEGSLSAHLSEQLGPDLPLAWVHQELGDLPEGFGDLVPGRKKPWGTAQAVLAARKRLHGPFGVANADDWYGPEALSALRSALADLPPEPPCPAVLVGFPMRATLPPSGDGVSRGRVEVAGGEVRTVVELHQVATRPDGRLSGRTGAGDEVAVAADDWASMNLWGFGRCGIDVLADGFTDFLEAEGADPGAEYALSTAVGDLLARDAMSLRLVPEGRRWFGVTHPGDAPWVRERLQELHDDGTYGPSLPDLLP
ncbi:MAG TPA: NTP transferase domain-containing protein [Longimicrobiales bacterium]|nr:NTP transferase domain-containing protein [Longimicrobiales bacterium]